jgi:MSHA biogenesis protein MshG
VTLYAYKGRSLRGEPVSGQMDGETADRVAARLFNGGITPIEISEANAKGEQVTVEQIARQLGLGRPTTSDLVLFARQMYTVTKSGLPLLRGLRGLAQSTTNPVLREALEDVLASLEAGRDLASSFARHPNIFSPLFISIVRVGEATGTLETAFLRLADYLKQEQETQDRVKAAMRYPIVVLAVIGIAVGVLTTLVIPKFAPLFQSLGNQIPLPTKIIIGASDIARGYWHFVLAGIVVLSVAVRQYVSTETGRYRWHKLKLSLPVLGKLAHEAILARISRSLAISLSAGMPMLQTLHIIAKSAGNEYMAERVLRLRDAVERGEPLSRAAASVGMFPPLVLQMMAVGEETGDVSSLLDEVAGFYEREVDFALKNLTSAMEPILIVFVGGVVLILALGVFLPLWEMIGHAAGGG